MQLVAEIEQMKVFPSQTVTVRASIKAPARMRFWWSVGGMKRSSKGGWKNKWEGPVALQGEPGGSAVLMLAAAADAYNHPQHVTTALGGPSDLQSSADYPGTRVLLEAPFSERQYSSRSFYVKHFSAMDLTMHNPHASHLPLLQARAIPLPSL
ncbi:hypothetical protein MMC24_000406 [Lignoscripta atroalba]|nr:hypothetical protein [Lignoscripta atroalba]